MPHPIDGFVEPVRRSRRAAARAVDRIAAGELGPEEVDFCDLLFGQVGPEAKLAGLGLLDDGGLCDAMVATMAHELRVILEEMSPLEDLEAMLRDRLTRLAAERAGDVPKGTSVAPAVDPERNARNNGRVVSRAASVLAVHLCQRAMHEAVGRVLREADAAQSAFTRDKVPTTLPVHGPLKLEEAQAASADAAIERLRRPHMADRRPRAAVPFEVVSRSAAVAADPLAQWQADMDAALGATSS